MGGFYKTVVDKKYDYSNISDIENVFEIEISKEEKENENRGINVPFLQIGHRL